MFYLIKSLKWTKHYGKETWYQPNSNGYTHQIAYAGIYTEEDKNNQHHKSIVAEKVIEFVPIDQKIVNKAKRQLSTQKKVIQTEISRLQERIKREEGELQKIGDKMLIGINNLQSLTNS